MKQKSRTCHQVLYCTCTVCTVCRMKSNQYHPNRIISYLVSFSQPRMLQLTSQRSCVIQLLPNWKEKCWGPSVVRACKCSNNIHLILFGCGRLGGLVVSALDSGSRGPGSSPGRVILLCSWARHFTLTVPLSTQEYKWVPMNCQENLTKYWEVN